MFEDESFDTHHDPFREKKRSEKHPRTFCLRGERFISVAKRTPIILLS
jgi:hypothetical protein